MGAQIYQTQEVAREAVAPPGSRQNWRPQAAKDGGTPVLAPSGVAL